LEWRICLTAGLLALAFLNTVCPEMRTASSSHKRTAAVVITCGSASRKLLRLVAAWRSSKLKVVLNPPKNRRIRRALWERFCAGPKESGQHKEKGPARLFEVKYSRK
jgi:hypothetical protein